MAEPPAEGHTYSNTPSLFKDAAMTPAVAKITFDDAQSPDHDPDLYRPATLAPCLETLADIDEQAVAFYHEHGYLAVRHALTPGEVDESIRIIEDLIVGRRTGHSMTMYEAAAQKAGIDQLSDDRKLDMVRKLAFFGDTAVQCGLPVLHHGLMDITQKLMGGREPKPFQIMTLLKPPCGGREKPWHQDHAYFNLSVDDRIVGIWIALDEATLDNGCMQLLDGGHKLGPIPHWQRRDWQICDTQIMGKTYVAAPLPPGGVLFFDSLLPHGTPTNHSTQRRRAMQFHYAPADGQAVSPEDRMAIFGTEGKDVTC